MRIAILILFSVVISPGHAHESHTGRADAHAPVGVMGDHIHKAGEWMLSYRFMGMHMDGNRDGRRDITETEVLADFAVAPTKMDRHMHMFAGMYAFNDVMTVMLMAPYITSSMTHITRRGGEFTTSSSGLGDIRLSAMYSVYAGEGHRLHVNFGLSIPTGSINASDETPLGEVILPYPMQIGSGSYSLLPGITYNGQATDWSWGGQLAGAIRLDDNDAGYRLGERLTITGWVARRWGAYLSTSLRLAGRAWANIDGADSRIATVNPAGVAIVPTAQTQLRAGSRIDAGVGLNIYMPDGVLGAHRLALEATFPVQQNLDGPQLETDWVITLGWQKAF